MPVGVRVDDRRMPVVQLVCAELALDMEEVGEATREGGERPRVLAAGCGDERRDVAGESLSTRR